MDNNYTRNTKKIKQIIWDKYGSKVYYEDYKIYHYDVDKFNNNVELYRNIIELMQPQLDNTLKKYYGIDAYIYYTDYANINAFADVNYLIGINRGVIEQLRDKIYKENIFFEKGVIYKHWKLQKAFFDKQEDSLIFQMFKLTLEFLYYHEFAHLLQFRNCDLQGIEIDKIFEFNDSSENEYKVNRHLQEIDADYCGGGAIVRTIVSLFDKICDNERTQELLDSLLSFALGCIFSLFRLLTDNRIKFYIKERSHPHPLIRATYISAFIIKALKRKGIIRKIKPKYVYKIVGDAIEISNHFFDTPYPNDVLNESHNNIDKYLAEKKIQFTNCSYLALNNDYPFLM